MIVVKFLSFDLNFHCFGEKIARVLERKLFVTILLIKTLYDPIMCLTWIQKEILMDFRDKNEMCCVKNCL